MDNYLILRAGQNLRLGSGITVEQEAAMCSSLCSFLTSHALLAPTVVLPAESWEGFELRAHDFTADGLAVIKCGLDRWMKGLDKGKPASDVTVLEKCLAKISQAGTA